MSRSSIHRGRRIAGQADVSPLIRPLRGHLLPQGEKGWKGGLDAGPAGEHPLGRGGAEAVAGAEEEEVGASQRSDFSAIKAFANPRNKFDDRIDQRLDIKFLAPE